LHNQTVPGLLGVLLAGAAPAVAGTMEAMSPPITASAPRRW
jgi:hypothetical protein